jgi:hypothetical protein
MKDVLRWLLLPSSVADRCLTWNAKMIDVSLPHILSREQCLQHIKRESQMDWNRVHGMARMC